MGKLKKFYKKHKVSIIIGTIVTIAVIIGISLILYYKLKKPSAPPEETYSLKHESLSFSKITTK